MNERLQNVLVGLLAAVAAASVVAALTSAPSIDPVTTGGHTSDSDAATTSAAVPDAEEDDEQDEQDDTSLEDLSAALEGEDDGAVDVVVIGDDTSNNRSEWVHLWAERLADERPVTVVHWAEQADVAYTTPDVLSESGEGVMLSIWSPARAGTDIAAAAERVEDFLPDAPTDLVLVNLGVNNDADEVGDQMQDLLDALRGLVGDGVPVGIVLQAEQVSTPEVNTALADFAADNGLATLDATGADGPQDWAETIDELLR
ncbi:SGNH/GDSL hydrolase family protein [Ornithinimicrobium sediminis]|uniref:SGNH/GDSL hydrolase family protein n=1 Tax=Ornithinimicrobium sediminis TaxID=2904603 RepID=UPI001E429ED4|nr:SGNH/GDSL hydrolase family protein [Ornithinimicrobium sediminis]MCE0485995.1 SGNH/GDSL hydrolase family protein [Ornithinimicrobium sediminis]